MMRRFAKLLVLGCGLAGFVLPAMVSGQELKWHPPQRAQLGALNKKLEAARQGKEPWVSQPAVLAFKSACFLAAGKLDTPTRGTRQTMQVEFSGGEEDFTSATVTVEFLGYADDSLAGERFSLELTRNNDGTWSVTAATRAAYGRGDAR